MTQVREGLRPLRPAWLSVSLVVSLVVVAGLLCLATLAWLPTVVDMPTQLGGIAAWWVVVLFVALAASSDVIYVPVRHGDAWEELTFVEVVIIWGVLILQPFPALASALVGFGLVALLMRRPAVKSLFNLGSYAVSGAALMVTYLALVGDAPRFGWRSVFALLVAALVFTALNLFMLSLILLAAEEVPPREFIAEQWALSVGMAVGSVGVATVTLAVFETSPALTAFAALPAVALWYAYRASSAHAEARERSHWLVALGQAVATPGEPEEVIPRAADALRRVYGADEYAVVLHSGDVVDPGLQCGRIGDRVELRIHHEIALIGDNRPRFANCHPQFRHATESCQRIHDLAVGLGHDLHGQGERPEGVAEFRLVHDHDETVRTTVDELLPRVTGPSALDEVAARIHLVGAVDGEIDVVDLVQGDLRNPVFLGQDRCLERCRHPDDVRHFPGLPAPAQLLDQQGGGRSGTEAQDHPGLDPLRRFGRHEFLHALLHIHA